MGFKSKYCMILQIENVIFYQGINFSITIENLIEPTTELTSVSVIGLRIVPKRLPGFFISLRIQHGCMQTCTLLGSQQILKNVLRNIRARYFIFKADLSSVLCKK